MKRIAVGIALALAVSACGPRNYVVLLDNPGGGSGKVIVSNKEGRQVLDQSGSATTINRSSKPPSTPWQLSVEKITETFARAFGARPARSAQYTIYFRTGGVEIEPESQPVYRAMLADVARRPGADATVTGHADRTDSDVRNEMLALWRAFTVRDDLVKAGLPYSRIEMDSYGEQRPAISTADNVPEVRNRRVEVTVR